MQITELGYAKINLCLDVIRKRPDGYHDVSMIMQSIGLYDTINLKELDEDRIVLKTNSAEIPLDARNIAYKAADAFKKRYGINKGIEINIDKNIPVAAGLAGGSTNAAAVLKGMNRLFNVNATVQELCELGVKLGADVPFCIHGGTMLSEGIGEVLTPLKGNIKCSVLLVKPSFPVSTKYVYEHLDLKISDKQNEQDAAADLSVTAAQGKSIHPDTAAAVRTVENGDLKGLCECTGNILETVTCTEYPELEEIKASMREKGADLALMSGSGPTVFGLFADEKKAEGAYNYFKTGKYASRTFLTDMI